jgi:hypothetical protein
MIETPIVTSAAPVRKYSLGLIILVFLIFPPAAFLLMWQDPTYHKNFKIFLLVFGVTALLVSLGNFSSLQKLTQLYSDVGIQKFSFFPLLLNSLIFLFGLLQLGFGLKFQSSSKKQVNLAALVLVLGQFVIWILTGLVVLSIILPIYQISSAF